MCKSPVPLSPRTISLQTSNLNQTVSTRRHVLHAPLGCHCRWASRRDRLLIALPETFSPMSPLPHAARLGLRRPAQPPPTIGRPDLGLPRPATTGRRPNRPRTPSAHTRPSPGPTRLDLLDVAGPGCPPRRGCPDIAALGRRHPDATAPAALLAAAAEMKTTLDRDQLI
jgi:hypothetical protein